MVDLVGYISLDIGIREYLNTNRKGNCFLGLPRWVIKCWFSWSWLMKVRSHIWHVNRPAVRFISLFLGGSGPVKSTVCIRPGTGLATGRPELILPWGTAKLEPYKQKSNQTFTILHVFQIFQHRNIHRSNVSLLMLLFNRHHQYKDSRHSTNKFPQKNK